MIFNGLYKFNLRNFQGFLILLVGLYVYSAQPQDLNYRDKANSQIKLHKQNEIKDLKKAKSIKKVLYQTDSYFDPRVDYSTFSGRVTDRDPTMNIFKISSENENVKFFRAGDAVEFSLQANREGRCKGYIRSTEEKYFVMHVSDLGPCWGDGKYFRRGSLLDIYSDQLAARVREGSRFRKILINRREDIFEQLNRVNHFLWTYDQQKVLMAAEYDQKILEMQKKKQQVLDDLISQKRDYLKLQRELMKRVDLLDRDMAKYRVEKNELYIDRWHLDQDLALPVSERPQELKPYEKMR